MRFHGVIPKTLQKLAYHYMYHISFNSVRIRFIKHFLVFSQIVPSSNPNSHEFITHAAKHSSFFVA